MSHDLDARSTTVSPQQAAERLGVEPSTLANWRWRGDGPVYVKCGGRVRYRLPDIAAWLDAQARASTAEEAVGTGGDGGGSSDG